MVQANDEAKLDARGGDRDSTFWWELLLKGVQYKGWAELLRSSLQSTTGPRGRKQVMTADVNLTPKM